MCLDIYITHCVGCMDDLSYDHLWFDLYVFSNISSWTLNRVHCCLFFPNSCPEGFDGRVYLPVLDRALKARFDGLEFACGREIFHFSLPFLRQNPSAVFFITTPAFSPLYHAYDSSHLPICSSSLCKHVWHNPLQFDYILYALCFHMFSFVYIFADTKTSSNSADIENRYYYTSIPFVFCISSIGFSQLPKAQYSYHHMRWTLIP